MARSSTPKGPKQVEALTHEGQRRRNIPTAELQSVLERVEEREPVAPVRYPRARPLNEGETRERDPDLDPQIVWNGARIRLSPEQVRRLVDTGEVEIGDAQLVWRGKDRQDWSDLVVQAPPLYIQEKIHPKAIIDDLARQAKRGAAKDPGSEAGAGFAPDLFAAFNGLDPEARTEFYAHDQNWSNRMILGDSLSVMASLAEREGLRGKVQCIYVDPPYGIKFNSNWQVSTLSRDVKDGKQTDISREPEQVRAFRDTWKDGIHSYLTYLRDRLTVMRDLLADSGSIFMQIGDENVHRVRAVMDEVFGHDNLASQIAFKKTAGQTAELLPGILDYVLHYAKDKRSTKYLPLFREKISGGLGADKYQYIDNEKLNRLRISDIDSSTIDPGRSYAIDTIVSQKPPGSFDVIYNGDVYRPRTGYWKTHSEGMHRLNRANRLLQGGRVLMYKRFLGDFPAFSLTNYWDDTSSGASQNDPKIYVVQTNRKVVERCILMATDPGDLVLDPTCGSGTTALVAEQWGRRWITIDTSRVALALARTRLMSARYPYYLLADSAEGRRKEAELTGRVPPDGPAHGDVRHGFVYERAPHVTLKSIANNTQIDTIWETAQQTLEPLRAALNAALLPSPLRGGGGGGGGAARSDPAGEAPGGATPTPTPPRKGEGLKGEGLSSGPPWEEWHIPREADPAWPAEARELHARWWEARIDRQRKIDASIAKAAEVELLYDRPYEDKSRIRVAGPFTVESLSPHRVVPADAEELTDGLAAAEGRRGRSPLSASATDFAAMVLEHLRTAGVHQSEKRDTIRFTALQPWPGEYVGAEGRFLEGETERRAAIFIGPEFGTLSRPDLVAAAREATEARFDVLIACAFAFDAHASELVRLGPLPILKAKMNPDLHMAEDLKNTGRGNLFVVFGEPDIDVLHDPDGRVRVRVNGVDVFDPNTGEIRSDDTAGIAAWFIDTDYDEESFFVRHAYFLGAQDPYRSLKTALKAEIDEAAWSTLYRDTSRPFDRPSTGRIAVKVINHFGDEVMKVFGV